jgi:D-inositol-3-phosphate glycosyltransferase
MQYGLPVVTSGNGGIVDWAQHERNSLIADPHNAADFATALQRLLTDTALHAKLSAQATKDAQQFSMQHYASGLVAIYERARTRHAA